MVTPIATKDAAAAPVVVRGHRGAKGDGIGNVARVVVTEVGNTRKVEATEMARSVTGHAEKVVVADGTEEAGEKVVADEDVVVPTEIHCEPVERMLRPSMEVPDRRCSCTVITSSC